MNTQEAQKAFRCVETDVRLHNISIRTALIKNGFLPSKFETPEFEYACNWYYSPNRTYQERSAFWKNSEATIFTKVPEPDLNGFVENPNDPEGNEQDDYNVNGDNETKEEKAQREKAAKEHAEREMEIKQRVKSEVKHKLTTEMYRMGALCRAIADNGGDAETCHIAINSLTDIENEGMF